MNGCGVRDAARMCGRPPERVQDPGVRGRLIQTESSLDEPDDGRWQQLKPKLRRRFRIPSPRVGRIARDTDPPTLKAYTDLSAE